MNKKLTKTTGITAVSLAMAALLAGCGSGGDGGGTTVNGDVPMAYVKRSTALSMNPTDGAPTADGGDLIIRQVSSGSAPEYNVTSSITQGKGDASDPEASYDGKKIVFALRCPTSNTSRIDGVAACTGRWNIWEYDMTSGGFTAGKLRRITSSNQHDDADPAYLPGGGFVFSSNRQAKAYANQALGQSYYALDEYERERVMNLHTMKDDGTDIQQISFNQSHDRNPVVLANGDILFSRWEHVGDRNRFAMFTVKPDGTNMFVFYGAQSPGNSFLHPREMDPKGPNKGQLSSSLMPLSRTQEGGALMFVDAAHYSEQNTPINREVSATGGQVSVTPQRLNQERGFSEYGRVTTPYPLWDGTNRVLVAYRPCQATRNGTVVPCLNLTAEEKARLGNRNRPAAEVAADAVKDNAPAAYGIYMFNPANGSMLKVADAPSGYMYTDPIPLQKRDAPQVAQNDPSKFDASLVATNEGLIEVRSVYDTDGLGRMGEGMLAAADLPAGCARGIPLTAPTAPDDTRAQVADLVIMKDPANPAYKCSPARFIRVSRAVAPPTGMTGLRNSIGETEFEQMQILGYSPIEPDGSFKLKIPADTPIGLSVIDTKGRAIQTHTNWIQVRPGERRTCDGCHSPRRGAALNSGAIVNTMPAALVSSLSSQHASGETMAATRTRLNPTLLNLAADPVFTDVWADTAQSGVTARDPIEIRYTGNANSADNLTTTAPATTGVKKGVINYPEHVQPIWEKARPGGSCVSCHTDTAKLSLLATSAGTGRIVSYEELVMGDPQLDGNGLPVTRLEEGVPMVVRQPALVETSSSAANSGGGTRKSRLGEIIFGETLKAGAAALTAHPNPPNTAPDHATLLNAAEKRVLTEWMDLGGQYYNDPFDPLGGTRSYAGLSEASFVATVQPILRANCMSACHMAVGSDLTTPAGTQFHQNRLVLTGSAEGDFQVTMSLVNDACTPQNSYLLSRPSTAPHPAGGTGAPLPAGSANYTTIANWIRGACP